MRPVAISVEKNGDGSLLTAVCRELKRLGLNPGDAELHYSREFGKKWLNSYVDNPATNAALLWNSRLNR